MNRAERRAAAKKGLILPPSVASDRSGGTALARVAIGFCHAQGGGVGYDAFARSLLHLCVRESILNPGRIVGVFDHTSSGVHIPDARNDIVRRFLANPAQPDYLWLIDADATFADDTLDLLLQVADPKERPLVGGLAFGVRPRVDDDGIEIMSEVGAEQPELFPTIYVLTEDGGIGIWNEYPRDKLVPAFTTGAHCILIHRSVLEHEAWLAEPHPQPWFRVVPFDAHKVMSEDQFFFVRSGSLGFPLFIHTGIRTGHVKTFIADEVMYDAQRFTEDATAEAVIEEHCASGVIE